MINFSKTTLLSTLLIIFLLAIGFFAFQWWQVKGELRKQIEQNENLMKQVNELQKEIEELKTGRAIEDEIIKDGKTKVTITTDKTEYRQGEKVKIIIKNNTDKKIFTWISGYCSLGFQKYKDGKWKTIEGAFYPRCCPCGTVCEPRDCIYMAPGETSEKEWDQIIDWCEESKKKMEDALGKYRFTLEYVEHTIECDPGFEKICCYEYNKNEWKTTHSNALIIK